MKKTAVLAIVAFMALVEIQICRASIVVFAFGKKTVIIAADSRETYSDGTFKDTACKIGVFVESCG